MASSTSELPSFRMPHNQCRRSAHTRCPICQVLVFGRTGAATGYQNNWWWDSCSNNGRCSVETAADHWNSDGGGEEGPVKFWCGVRTVKRTVLVKSVSFRPRHLHAVTRGGGFERSRTAHLIMSIELCCGHFLFIRTTREQVRSDRTELDRP